jgi:phosphate transport system substrate-binding protein
MRSVKSTLIIAFVLCTLCFSAEHPKFNETFHAKANPDLPVYKSSTTLSGSMKSVGADTMEELMKLWIADFHKMYPDVSIDMEAKASGTAGPALTEGTAQIGPVAREMLPNEIAPFQQKFGYVPFAVRVAGGSFRTPGKTHAIAFLVNAKNPIQKLTFAQLDAIYSKTRKRGHKEVTTWGDVGAKGEWADKPIHLWGLIRPNGIANFVQERVLLNGEYKDGITERTTVGSLPALDAIAQGVAADPYAIGYSGFSSVIEGTKPLALAISDNGPFYKGTFEEVVSQRYPLSRVIYIYVNRGPGQPLDPKVREFLRFAVSRQGQQDVEKEGVFLPLPPQMVKEEIQKIEQASAEKAESKNSLHAQTK